MTEAQKMYANTPQREFAINFKKYSPELIQELNLIHKIQINLSQQAFYNKKATEYWTKEGKAQTERKYNELLSEYEMIYGAYDLNLIF